MSGLTFTAFIKIRGVNPYISISKDQATILKPDWKKPMPVREQINKKPEPALKINMMPVGDGGFYLYLHGAIRKASNTKVGDLVEVTLSFDSKYKNGPQHSIPRWFISALAKNKKASTSWDALPPSRKK